MKTKAAIIVGLLTIVGNICSQTDSLLVNYYENIPFAYKEGTTMKGIEVEIIAEYVKWLKEKKNIQVEVKYNAISEFGAFYNAIRNGNPNVIGLGSVTDNAERRKEVAFSPPYLENTALLITDGTVPTIKSKDPAEVATVLTGMTAVVVSKSNHVNYMNEVKKVYNQTQLEVPDLVITFTEKESEVLKKIVGDKKVFGYVDIIAFWNFVKTNPTKFLKIQKIFSEPKEFLGFIMPKRNIHSQYLNEFFESGFGFTATKIYHQLLEKYLAPEIIGSVEIK